MVAIDQHLFRPASSLMLATTMITSASDLIASLKMDAISAFSQALNPPLGASVSLGDGSRHTSIFAPASLIRFAFGITKRWEE